MGKSPGKWIKTVLFGKKYSKSNFSKSVTTDKKTATKTHVQDSSQNSPVISDPYPLTEIGVETLELEREASGPQCDAIALSPVNQSVDSPNGQVPVSLSDADMKRQHEAAAKAQAAFRGYLARRAFQALRGIIRLQALIRGHLVRRQAVATLRCMRAIVKIQALARGHKDAKQVGIGANLFFGSQKLATNIFVRKLLVKMPNDTPLSLQYDVAEPNSSWSWLERWSSSHIWEPPVRAKKTTKPKPQRKTVGLQTAESEAGKSKRTIRKAPTPSNGENGTLTSETDKPKRNPGKLTSTQTESAQEQAASELERVKRNLRKVSSSSSVLLPEKPELDTEKQQPLQSVEVAKTSPPHDTPDLEIAIFPEKQAHLDSVVDNPDILETPLKNEQVNAPLADNSAVETESVENDVKIESALNLDDDISVKEEQTSKEGSKEGQKIKKRRSLPAKQEFTEKISQNSPSVPSYMAATESAKAKLRAQGSTPKFGEDGGADYGVNARRHSLPASTNGKLSSISPRLQKHVQANGKGGSKTNMALPSSRDDKALPGWRR